MKKSLAKNYIISLFRIKCRYIVPQGSGFENIAKYPKDLELKETTESHEKRLLLDLIFSDDVNSTIGHIIKKEDYFNVV